MILMALTETKKFRYAFIWMRACHVRYLLRLDINSVYSSCCSCQCSSHELQVQNYRPWTSCISNGPKHPFCQIPQYWACTRYNYLGYVFNLNIQLHCVKRLQRDDCITRMNFCAHCDRQLNLGLCMSLFVYFFMTHTFFSLHIQNCRTGLDGSSL